MNLRPYQRDLVDRVRAAFVEGACARSVVMQLGTGGGKTATASELIRSATALGNRVVFAAHLDALIDDTSERLTRAGIFHGIVQAGRGGAGLAPVQVCSLATLHRRGERPPAELLILDECHRAMAKTVRAILEAYPSADILGLTATPQRGDGQPLRDVFERMVCGPSVRELVRLGALVPSVVYSPPAPTDGTLAMDPVAALERYAPGASAMVFCRDREHAEKVAMRIGERAVVILGDTPREARRQARQRLEAGEPLVLVGCGVFLEGWDSPAVKACVLARSFTHCGTYLQAVGRILRPAPGKAYATVVDLVGAGILHGLPEDERVWTLDGVRRSGAALLALARCRECFAIFPAGPRACPRCGAEIVIRKRRLTRVEQQELSRLDGRPLATRDEMAVLAIAKTLRRKGKWNHLPDSRLQQFAVSIFRRKHGRMPGEPPKSVTTPRAGEKATF